MRVLLVEDNPVNQLVSRRMLQALGQTVELVCDGQAAVEAAQRGEYELVLMDVHMPHMDGLEATRQIRQLRGPSASVPILALTASAMEHERQACLDAGMNAVLLKPLTLDLLEQALATYARLAPPRSSTAA